jgi:hypothetical protein
MAGCEGDATTLSRASIAGAALCGDGGDGGGSARCDESAAED